MSAVGNFTLNELYPVENVTMMLIAGGNWGEGEDYCARVVTGGGGWNYYANSINTLEILSPPSTEVCSNATTNATHKAFRICWDVTPTNFTGALSTDYGDAYMFGIYYTNSVGNYSVYAPTGNVYYDTNFVHYRHLARKYYIEYMGGTQYCYNFSAFTRNYHRLPIWEGGIPFVDLAGGTVADPITPDDIHDWLVDDINRSEFVQQIDTFPGSEEGTMWLFDFFFGGLGSYENATVFQIPANTMVYQTYGGIKFNDEYDFYMGERAYSSTTKTNYLTDLGAVYTRGYLPGTYNTVYGDVGIYGSFIGKLRPVSIGISLTDHGFQWKGDSMNISQSLFQGAGRLNSNLLSLHNSILVSESPEIQNNNDWDDGYTFTPYEINNFDVRPGNSVENTFKNADLSKMIARMGNLDSTVAYWYLWVIRGYDNSTRMMHFINCKLPEPWFARLYKQGTLDMQGFINEEFELTLSVVDSATGNPIENATLTIQDASGTHAMGGKSATALWSAANYYLYPYDTAFFALCDPTAHSVGDYIKIGMEFMRVTGVNATGVNVTRGEFNTTPWGLQTISPGGNNSNGIHMKTYLAWREQYSDSEGKFEEVRLVNRSMRLGVNESGFPQVIYKKECEDQTGLYKACQNYTNFTISAPFTITVNASGYNNFTAYYTPTAENSFTIGLKPYSNPWMINGTIVIKEGALIIKQCT